ncbi:MAG TPA: VCBS repeat-containing protein, partial [Gemmatimonadetes bacterium]|nr:VCBS repeat-containing protein [Gemmatimonadota bacterium]
MRNSILLISLISSVLVGQPSFSSGTHISGSNTDYPLSVFAIDLDSDGDVDILSASYIDKKISWFENNGAADPSFTFHGNISPTANADGAYSVYATDIDNDGDIDVLSASAEDGRINWYENNGSESFTERNITTSADGAQSVYAADIDSDGDIDVLSASFNDDKIAWYENDGAADPSFTARTITTSADAAKSVYAIDLDGDGDIDVLSASLEDDKIAWYENDGAADPSFTARTITTSADGAKSVFAADVDGDGDIDVLSASIHDDKVVWYENDGAADPAFTASTITSSADGASSVYAADVDRDGDIDVLSASSYDDKIAWYENNGAADPSFTAHTITTSADGAASVFAADLDSDGDIDVLSASLLDDKVIWYENTTAAPGTPSFTAADIATSADGAFSVFVADMDNDGDMDIVSASENDDTIAWYENDGAADPSFTAADIATSADGAQSVFVADLDNDGDMDIVSASYNDDTIAWYENNGAADPSFTAADIATSADGAEDIHVADMDNDGDMDIVSASTNDNTIAWYENDGAADPSFTAADIATSAQNALAVYVADLDGDGDMDIVSASVNDDAIAWYENDGAADPSWTAAD